MSRLDRILLSEEWCLAWPNYTQTARLRGLSDHCSLVLSANEDDWGPRPSRMLKCWRDVPGYQVFVKDKWKELHVDGWGVHLVITGRRRGNAITVIQADGVILEGVNPIRQAVFLHFTSHFKVINVEKPGVDNLQFKRLNQLESSSLITPFSEEEVKSTVWDCDSFKSPGPDGVNFGFIKDFWAEIRGDVMRFISEFHRNDKMTKGIKSTFIALIPKFDSPQRFNDFRPISLVGILYKILAKILDGILIANELVDEARKSKKELMLFKVDFEKAYDSVDWGYLDDFMGRMSFPALWRKWIKESEGLNVLMEAVVAYNLFTGYSIGERDPVSVSHLQFVDDTLLLGGGRGGEDFRKIPWVKSISLRKECGGLGVSQVREFNLALLGKWCWWMLVDREGLWFSVLAARYGVERGRLRDGGQRWSTWWREIARIQEGNELGGSWFGEHVSKRVMDGIPLCERFGCLFDLAETKWRTVAEMFSLGWGADGEAWQWRRQLWVWEEEMLRECQSLLLNLTLQAQSSNRHTHLTFSYPTEGFHLGVTFTA
ncbi:hypothetical protein TSUD_59990 [Trifolium subterraneum]|uniref:Reverse transcriptase domain-containing protein n=1 Tax=Trifolium subterraneum TaxID=3900 RepID=A0A2Z6NAB9_TRISU|nr:hypothetical protein TSUD_59990 [Trifolium subterraneum]